MLKFKVGDEVVLLQAWTEELIKGSTGKIVRFSTTGNIGVSWEGFTDGHHCHGTLEDCSGWYVPPRILELAAVSLENE